MLTLASSGPKRVTTQELLAWGLRIFTPTQRCINRAGPSSRRCDACFPTEALCAVAGDSIAESTWTIHPAIDEIGVETEAGSVAVRECEGLFGATFGGEGGDVV